MILDDSDAHPRYARKLRRALDREFIKYNCTPINKEFIPVQRLIQILDVVTLTKQLEKCDSFLKANPGLQDFRMGFSKDQHLPKSKSGRRSAFMAAAKQIHGNIKESTPSNSSVEHRNTSSAHQKQFYDKSYTKIFAILVLIGRPARIMPFIDEGVCDADLPFARMPLGGGSIILRRKSAQDEELRCFDKWDHLSMKKFEQYQWKFLAPFFERGSGRHIHHQILGPKVILPFTSYSLRSENGAFGQVSKVKIHSDYHKFGKDAVCISFNASGVLFRILIIS